SRSSASRPPARSSRCGRTATPTPTGRCTSTPTAPFAKRSRPPGIPSPSSSWRCAPERDVRPLGPNLTAVALLLASACAPPFAMKRDAVNAQKQATRDVLDSGELSRRTKNLLYDQDLLTRYEKDPAGAIAALHADLVSGHLLPHYIVALAELAYHHAEHGGGSPYYLASA